MSDKYTISAFSFWDFCLAVQDAVQKGYVFSDTNENMPQAYIGSYSCVMVQSQPIEADNPVVTAEDVQDVVQNLPKVAPKTTRKSTK